MRVERLVESRPAIIELSPEQADALAATGRRLVSQSRWWGDDSDDTDANEAPDQRTAIDCQPYGPDRWRVLVPNAVGVIAIPDLQLVIEPKIPLPHLLHLFARSGSFPRVDTTAAELAATDALWPLVASWYVAALEGLLRSGLASGYRDARDELMVGRGRVLAVGTARLLLKGRARLDCQYEEFDLDTPLNRVLRAAASAVAGSPALARDIRRRAKRAIDHMEGVGRLHAADVRTAWPERHTWRYAAPLQLARHVLAATGRGIDVGDEHGFAFLIRTPEMVEEALRRIAQAALGDVVTVEKRTRFLTGSAHSLTPDVSFGTQAVGDVKYKVWRGDWDRADLYQLVAFATGFDVTNAVRIGFSATAPTPAPPKPAHVQVGRVSLARCDWPFEDSLSPQDAEESLTRQLRAWWAGLPRDASQLALALAR